MTPPSHDEDIPVIDPQPFAGETVRLDDEGPLTAATVRTALLGRVSLVAGSPIVGILGVLLTMLVTFGLLKSSFASTSNYATIITTAAILGIVTLGQMVVLISGGFDLSVGGIVPLGGVLFAVFGNHGLSFLPDVLCVIAVGVCIGAVTALVIGRLHVNPLIATLGMLSITGGLAFTISNGQSVTISPALGILGNTGPLYGLPYFVFAAVALFFAVDLIMRRSIAGRLVYALGGNAEAARIAGIRIEVVRIGVYATSAALAAFAGACYASQFLVAEGNIGTDATLTSITAAVLGGAALTGGVGTVPGAAIGILVLATLGDGLTILRISPFYQQDATGAILILAIAFSEARSRSNLTLGEILRFRRS